MKCHIINKIVRNYKRNKLKMSSHIYNGCMNLIAFLKLFDKSKNTEKIKLEKFLSFNNFSVFRVFRGKKFTFLFSVFCVFRG